MLPLGFVLLISGLIDYMMSDFMSQPCHSIVGRAQNSPTLLKIFSFNVFDILKSTFSSFSIRGATFLINPISLAFIITPKSMFGGRI